MSALDLLAVSYELGRSILAGQQLSIECQLLQHQARIIQAQSELAVVQAQIAQVQAMRDRA